METHLGFVLFSFIFVFIYLIGCYNFMTNFEENRCNMTYMFEYPKLIKVSLPSNVTNLYKKYGLYAYGEGRYIERVRDMKFSGIPVLFIPGNRGSPKQVRSLASISLRKAVGSRSPYHFDFFAVDLNEDYSGIFGGFLNDQTKFVDICIKKILSLYRPEFSTKSVILIGHSMGGVVAKGLFLEPNFNHDSVRIIITLAAPHSPALLLDPLLASYYDRINSFWDNNSTVKKNLNLISIGGGPRDLLVKPSLISTPHADTNIITTSVRDVWMSVDHLCILWCKELILVIARALFDCVDLKTNLITEDVNLRRDVFKYHLIERSGSKRYPSRYPIEVPLWNGIKHTSNWYPMVGTHMLWSEHNGVTLPTYLTISLATAFDTLAVQTQNHETKDWIFACVVDNSVNNVRVCKTGTNLSHKAKISPNVGIKRKSALIDLSKLRMDGYTHVVVRTLPTNEYVQISLDLFKKKQRTLVGSANYFLGSNLLKENEAGSLYYVVEMPGLQKIWQAHEISIESSNCSLPLLAEVNIIIPWSLEGATNIISGSKGSLPVMVYSSKNNTDSSNIQIELLLNPQCTYKVGLDRSLSLSLAAVIAKYGINVISLITVCLLLTLAYQLKELEEKGTCSLLQTAMPIASKPYIIIQASAIISAILQQASTYFTFIPPIDMKGQTGFMELLIIPVFLYMTAFAFTYIIGCGFLLGVIFQGQAFNAVLLRFLNKFCFGLAWLSDYVMSGANKVPIIVAAFMLSVAHSACGGLALSIGFCFYFFKMISLYEDFWEEIVYWPLRVLKTKLREIKEKKRMEVPKFEIPPIKDISFHLTLLLLWAIVVAINIPTVLVWAKQYRYNTKLQPDPGFFTSIIMCICAGALWQTDTPKTGLVMSKPLSHLIFLLSVFIMIYGQTSIYRLSYIVALVFILVTLHQIIAPWFTPEEEIPELVEGSVEDFQFESRVAEVLHRGSLEGAELNSDLSEFVPHKKVEDKGTEEKVEQEEEEEEEPEGEDIEDKEESEAEEQKDEQEKNINPEVVRGEETPPSEASSSSFEQISEKDIS